MAPKIRATVLLCDAAQAIGGKLYVLGGGWSQMLVPPGQEAANVTNMGLAIRLEVPRSYANSVLGIAARLVNADGGPVEVEGRPVAAEGPVAAGGMLTFGDAAARRWFETVVALQFNGVPLAAGAYTWEVSVNDDVVSRSQFQVTVLSAGSFGQPGFQGVG